MTGTKRVLFPLALLCVMAIAAGVAHGSMDYATGPGTVQYALAQPDGARVSLTMVVIGRANAAGVAVHEWWDKTNSVAALFSPPAGLEVGQTIDLEGWMTTLSGGRRAVLCERIAFYLDTYGSPLDAVPPIKGLLEPSVWPSKGWIPVSPAQSGMSSMSGGGIATVLDDLGPPTTGDPLPGVILFAPPGSIAGAKCLADGDALTEPITGKIVTAATGKVAANCIYIEEPDRSAGIRVNTSSTFAVGEAVSVSGTLATVDGERVIQATSVTSLGMATPIKPSGIVNRDLGGGDFEYDSQSGAGQQGMYDARYADFKASGLNNIGLLVRTRGKVTHAESGCIYIDDGSSADDGSGHIGVRVEALSGVLLPTLNATAEITGISSCRDLNGHIVRVLRVRTQHDAPVVIRVKPNGNNANDGSTWALAKATVQGAISAATAGMEIWVAAGTYSEYITLKAGVQLYGGFAGNETRREERNVPGNPTILDGGGSRRVVLCPSGLTSSAVIDGFTIRNGSAASGGGIYCSSSPTISNNTIASNRATSYGGGIYCCNNSSAIISGNTITGNSGGGIYCSTSSPTISDNNISGNTSGIYCGSSSSPSITNNSITENGTAYYGGGIYCHSSSPTIADNAISGNSATYGGGISCYYSSSPTIRDNTITGNSASYGGAIHCDQSSRPTITSNTITDNDGEGVYCYASAPTIAGNIVTGNTCGVRCQYYSSPAITNNTITSNSGGGISCYSSSPAIANNIVAFNGTGIGGGTPVLKHNCVYGNTSYNYSGVASGDGDISADPMFADMAQANLHIQPNSPCFNAGWNEAPGIPATDIDDQARISGPRVDIGADELYYPDDCIWYNVILNADPAQVEIGDTSTITVTVLDVVTEQPISGCRVDFIATDGEIESIYNDDGGVWPPDDHSITGYGISGLNGMVYAAVTRGPGGWVTVTAEASNSCETGKMTGATPIWFYDPDAPPVDLLFLIDATGSTAGGTAIMQGVTQTVDYLYQQLQAQGRTLRVAGIKFSDGYITPDPEVCGNSARLFNHPITRETFTTDRDAFNAWVRQNGPGGSGEYQLDILMCAKDMMPTAYPGLYTALATDEDSDSTNYTIQQVRDALIESGAIVFIDPALTSLVTYYEPLAVNGGAVEREDANIGTFEFHNMRQAILLQQ